MAGWLSGDCRNVILYFCALMCSHLAAFGTLYELKLAFAFIFTMPGVPYLYYGDEIGMRYLELATKEGGYFRTGSRTPMQWNSSKNAGFTTGTPWINVNPNYTAINTEAALADPDSVFYYYQKLLRCATACRSSFTVPSTDFWRTARRSTPTHGHWMTRH